MTQEYLQILEAHVREAFEAIKNLRESSMTLPSYYDFAERELASYQAALLRGAYGQHQAAVQARELAAQLIRTLTDYIADDEHPLISALLRLQSRGQAILDESPHLAHWRAGAGTRVLIGRPARPMSGTLYAALCDVVRQSRDICFAYVPQMYIEGQIDPPKQVLYLVLRDDARGRVEDVMKAIGSLVHARWPKGEFIDMLPAFSDHAWLHDVIRTGCFLAANDEELHRRCVEQAKSVSPERPER